MHTEPIFHHDGTYVETYVKCVRMNPPYVLAKFTGNSHNKTSCKSLFYALQVHSLLKQKRPILMVEIGFWFFLRRLYVESGTRGYVCPPTFLSIGCVELLPELHKNLFQPSK